jgi:EAL domain-containing protein (putative c-di-GMP-specific phosphodiesterase class I)
VSIGIAHYPSTTDAPEDLLRNADAAMYRAKRDGGTRFQFYCEEMSQKAREAIGLQSDLRHALDAQELELHFQPKLDSKTSAVLGAEALLRWRRPGHGLVPPLEFIPLAERTGLIVPIGTWVLRTACAQASAWAARGLRGFSVAVNISARQFRDRALLEIVRAALSQSGLPPRCLELEITEGTLMEDLKVAASVLRELRALGVRVAIDDFGTGYSSLSYLRCLPVDTLKVDRSFVREITTNHDSAAITIAILTMARSLKLNVVAEGVEKQEELEFLARHDCPEVQGFLFSRPLPHAEFLAWWSARQGRDRPVLE